MKEISAGAIVYTRKNNNILYLVSKDFHENWGFPKGHLENNETETQAALREIKEEVGLDVEIDVSFRDELVYVMPNGKEKHSIYFIAYYENQQPQRQLEEIQEIRLLSYAEAYEILTFQNMKDTLKKADIYLQQ